MAAFTVLQYPLMLLAGGTFYLVFIYAASQMVNVQNIIMEAFPGVITQQTIDTIMFPLGILMASPALVLFILAVWAIAKTVTEAV